VATKWFPHFGRGPRQVLSIANSTISARTADVTLDFVGFQGSLSWLLQMSSGTWLTLNGPTATTKLLCGRAYALAGEGLPRSEPAPGRRTALTVSPLPMTAQSVALDVGGTTAPTPYQG